MAKSGLMIAIGRAKPSDEEEEAPESEREEGEEEGEEDEAGKALLDAIESKDPKEVCMAIRNIMALDYDEEELDHASPVFAKRYGEARARAGGL